jgi:hypothetical protein
MKVATLQNAVRSFGSFTAQAAALAPHHAILLRQPTGQKNSPLGGGLNLFSWRRIEETV